jgi:hypothetical protein
MVQVDIFWSYAIGAGLANAASRQLIDPTPDPNAPWRPKDESLLGNRYFTATIIYLAAFFAPSGLGLLWAFPSWETMHAGDRALPTWLVMLFAITNVTQGMLGFWVVRKLLNAGKPYLAALQMVLAYFCMFFVLVHGWDGKGYQRFFSATKDTFLEWKVSHVASFLVSDVACTLYGMGLILLPVLFWLMTGWLAQGRAKEPFISRIDLARRIVRVILAGSLGLAIAASILVHWMGWFFGLVVFAILAQVFALRKGRFLHSWAAAMLGRDPAAF